MLNRLDIKEVIDKLLINYQIELDEEKIKDLITLWHNKIKYWELDDLQKVISYLIENRNFMPRISHLFSTYKQLEFDRKSQETKISHHCNMCKDTGIRAYKKDGIIHATYCTCKDGDAIHRNNPLLPSIEFKDEYPIHTSKGAFTGHLPKGSAYRLSKEVAGKHSFMANLTEQIESGKIKISDAVSDISETMKPEELPF